MTALAVAIGGALGALSRYGLGTWVQGLGRTAFPFGTLTVNLLGCFLLGAVLPLLDPARAPDWVRRFVTVGALGAFTTFSTFSLEAIALLEARAWGRLAAYVLGSVGLGILAVLAGLAVGQAVASTRS